ncbi:MAG: hypothetical protein A3E01_06100 [Gammaproteobacteria bacterium RIFCSPHIGHO2_12_FULL_63_22]|nr:MAG: hypothetical protein A3E01_06100 [Gammaproteobacteria bacterium RIFCSPHIGHO2_12_FULL_63_22]
MATEPNRPERGSTPATQPASAPKYSLEEAVALIAQSIAQQGEFQKQLVKATPKPRTTLRDFLKKHPQKRLHHEVFQAGRPVNPAGLSQDTIDLLDTLDTRKSMCDGMVDVVRIRDGVGGANSRIHLLYNNQTLEQRMAFYMRFPTFTALVKALVAEQAAQGITPVHETSAAPVDDDDDDNIELG